MSELNLLPESYVKERMRYRIDLICVALFAVIMGGLIVVETVTRGKLETAKKEFVETNAQYAKAVNKTKAYFQLESKQSKLLKQVAAAATVTQRIPRSYLLAAITNARGTEMLNLTHLSITTQKSKPAGTPESSGKKGRGKKAVRGKSSAETPAKTEHLSPMITITLEGDAQKYKAVEDFFESLKRCDAIDAETATWPVSKELSKLGKVRRHYFEIKFKVKKNLDVLNLLKGDKPANSPEISDGKGAKK